MRTALLNGRIHAGRDVLEGKALLIEKGLIAAIVEAGDVPGDAQRHDFQGDALAAGFIDVQVNGGGGALFNADPSVETIAAIGAAHARFGTTGFLPTIISADLARVAAAIAASEAAIAAGIPGVLGVHVEGPFLNPERKGIHDAANFRPLDEEALALLTAPRRGRTLVTLAPEMNDPAAIRTLVKAGVIVCAGHTDADYQAARTGLDAGIRGFTHLFNAMSPLRARQPGVVGAALTDPESWCGIIVDGIHVHPSTLRVALGCKGIQRLMLVTDAMPSVGSAEKSFVLQGRTIRVENGVCVGPDGTLAGCDLDMASAVRNAMAMLDVSAADALTMASANPAEFLGLDGQTGRIAPGLRADLVQLTESFQVRQAWCGGRSLLP